MRTLIASALQLAIDSIAVVSRPRVSVLLLAIGCLSGSSLQVQAQAPPAAANLAAGISQIRAGDYFAALFTLNQVVKQASGPSEDSATLARAHAFRAMAYSGLRQPERASAAVMLALKADPNVAVGATDFSPATVALFAEARRPVSADPETAGQDAEQAGRFQQAFLSYLSAFQSLPEPPASADDHRLREKIIGVVGKLDTKPPIPQEARDHLRKAQDLMDAEAILGSVAGTASQQAAAELRQSIRLAPWWPDAIFRFATVLQKVQRADEALVNLSLYRLADPEGYAAMVGRVAPKTGADRAATTTEAATSGRPAVIYVYWLPTSRSMGVKPKTLCDGELVANIQAGHVVRLNATPGIHSIKVYKETYTGQFVGGQDHYIRAAIEGYPARLKVRLTSAADGSAEIRDREIVPNDAKRTFSAECKAGASAAKPRSGS